MWLLDKKAILVSFSTISGECLVWLKGNLVALGHIFKIEHIYEKKQELRHLEKIKPWVKTIYYEIIQ